MISQTTKNVDIQYSCWKNKKLGQSAYKRLYFIQEFIYLSRGILLLRQNSIEVFHSLWRSDVIRFVYMLNRWGASVTNDAAPSASCHRKDY